MKISQKLTLGFISVALLAAVVGYISINVSQRALQKSVGQTSATRANEILEYIDRCICNRIESFQEYKKDIRTHLIISESNREFEKLDNIQNYIDEQDHRWISVPKEEITAFMHELMDNRLSEKLREKLDFYEEKDGYKVFGEVFVTNKYGANAAQTGKTSDYYQADEKWWQEAKKDGLYVSDVEYDKSANVYSIDLCIRNDDESGNFLGITKVVLNIEETINLIKEAEEEEEEEGAIQFKLLTKDGRVIYATEGYESLEPLSEQLLPYILKSERVEHEHYFIADGAKPGQGDELFAHAHSKGYKDYKGSGWILVTQQETIEIFASVIKLRNQILTASLAITTLAVIIGLLISRSISGPVGKLSVAATQIGKGRLDGRLDIKSNDEIGQLAASFNKMAEDLSKTTASRDELDAANQQLRASQQQLKAANQQLDASNQQLRATEQQLKAGNQQLRANEQQLRALNLHLTERAKELDCLYRVSELLTEANKSVDDIFTEAVNFIPPAWQYPEITCAKIVIKGHEFVTSNFRDSQWKMSSDITTSQGKIGFIEVCYLEEKPVIYEGPFLKEERGLIDALCKQAGSIYKRKQAEQLLEASNRDLKDFVHIASHDLREPSRKVSSFGEILAESLAGKLNDDEQENLDFMINGAERMQQMVDSLLVYSRVTTKDVAFEEVDLNEMIEQLKDLELANNLEEANGSVLVPEPLPSIDGDHSQIRQLLQNLIANALKYRKKDTPPEITIRTHKQDDNMVRVEVQDNGIGIEEKQYNNIFVMFRRLYSRQEYSGTGIGLAVCKKIVERHKGEIGVSSTYGQGSTFWFTIPAAKTAGREQEQLVSSLTS